MSIIARCVESFAYVARNFDTLNVLRSGESDGVVCVAVEEGGMAIVFLFIGIGVNIFFLNGTHIAVHKDIIRDKCIFFFPDCCIFWEHNSRFGI